MFGPDKCGNDNKLHFIFRHKNPKNGTIEEKHAKKPTYVSFRMDRIRDNIRGSMKVASVTEKMKRTRLALYGQVMWRHQSHMTKRVISIIVE
jgi:hypothetical protein